MSKHTIKVFTVFLPDGTVELQYIHHNEDHPSEDSPGTPLFLAPGETVRWKSMSNTQIAVHFDDSPFTSGDLDVPGNKPQTATVWETIGSLPPDANGDNPDFKYSVTVSGVPTDDPDIVIDLSGGGPPKMKKPKVATKKKAKAKKK
jgi:hypothetical protein